MAKKARGYTVPKAKQKYLHTLADMMHEETLHSFWVPGPDIWWVLWDKDGEWAAYDFEYIQQMHDTRQENDQGNKPKRKSRRKTK